MTAQARIAAVSLNSAVDQTVIVPDFAVDAVNRVESSRVDAGGKGVNVGSFLAHFSHAVAVAGLLGRENEALFARHFAEADVTDACLRVDGATRTNIKIIDPESHRITDLNFPGITASEADLGAVRQSLEALLVDGLDWVALSGSLPKGLPVTAYTELATWAKTRNVRVALDTSGPPLAAALAARPDIVKPNIAELRELLHRPLETRDEVVRAARQLVADGIGLVAVSMGEDGAILVTADRAVLAVPPRATVASTVGAGDAMVAGLIHAASLGLPLDETARLATAFSLGALGEIGPRLPAREKIEALAHAVAVSDL